jgi:hypothetical protein
MKQETIKDTLQEIDALLKRGVLPVSNGHLNHLSQEGDILAQLLLMKSEGLICGDVITIGADVVRPHRMTNIRLTCLGMRRLSA